MGKVLQFPVKPSEAKNFKKFHDNFVAASKDAYQGDPDEQVVLPVSTVFSHVSAMVLIYRLISRGYITDEMISEISKPT